MEAMVATAAGYGVPVYGIYYPPVLKNSAANNYSYYGLNAVKNAKGLSHYTEGAPKILQ